MKETTKTVTVSSEYADAPAYKSEFAGLEEGVNLPPPTEGMSIEDRFERVLKRANSLGNAMSHIKASDMTDLKKTVDLKTWWDSETRTTYKGFQFDSRWMDIKYMPVIDTSKLTTATLLFAGLPNLESLPEVIDLSGVNDEDFDSFNDKGRPLTQLFRESPKLTKCPELILPKTPVGAPLMFMRCSFYSIPQSVLKQIEHSHDITNLCVECFNLRNLTFKNVPLEDKRYEMAGIAAKCPKLESVKIYAPKSIARWGAIWEDPLLTECVLCVKEIGEWGICALAILEEITFVGGTSLGDNEQFDFGGCFKLKRILGAIRFGSRYNVTLVAGDGTDFEYVVLDNLGAQRSHSANNFTRGWEKWGSGSEENRQSLVDSLMRNTYDRAAAGWPSLTLNLPQSVIDRLTKPEIAAITLKGYNLAAV